MGAADTHVINRGRRLVAFALAGLVIAAPAAHAQATPATPATPTAAATTAPFGTSAVVLVSGFNSSSPFSTPACAAADRGPTWGVTTGPAAALGAAGLQVFTAPAANAGDAVAASCLGGQSTPDIPSDGSTVIDTNGELAGNQAALVAFLQFLNQSYGITTVALVGHSDGGLWSRAAISQLQAGSPVTITGLTTIGTPHTGSFGADLAVAIGSDDGSCNDLSGIEYAVCLASVTAVQAVFADLGQDVIEELSSSWLSQWNPTTSIGCSVTTLGGDHVGWDLGVGTYYTANDGIVGQASALNQGTDIPFLDAAPFTPVAPPGGLAQLYDVVHSVSLSFLSSSNELNTPAVAQAVTAAVQTPPSGPCAIASSSALKAGATSAAPVAVAAAARPTTRVALRVHQATRNGHLPASGQGDAVVLLQGASARCGSRVLPAVPLMGSPRVRIAAATCSKPLTIRGKAMRLSSTGDELRVTRSGNTLRWHTTTRLQHARTQVRVDGKWRTVKGSSVRVPAATHEPALRVRGVDSHGRVVRAITRVAV